jgi:aerobic-type carbon monoxide dehydrogenase small subunit (CoxS/CutS family)
LDLTGCKPGCGEGMCGACTVLVEGRPARACVTAVGDVTGRTVTTIEGLACDGRLDQVQEAFLETEAFQCGYCTPGMVLSAVGLLKVTPKPTVEDIVAFMDGNLCRCGAYLRIVDAICLAAGTR